MTEKNTNVKIFRKVVLSIGTFFALFFLLAFVPKIITDLSGEGHKPIPGREWEGQVMLAMFITYLVGYTIGWWWRLWGGIIIILASLIVSIPFAIIDENYGSLIFGIPQFVIGILYILLYRSEKLGSIESRTLRKE